MIVDVALIRAKLGDQAVAGLVSSKPESGQRLFPEVAASHVAALTDGMPLMGAPRAATNADFASALRAPTSIGY